MRGVQSNVASDKPLFLARVTKGVRLGVIGPNGSSILRAKISGRSSGGGGGGGGGGSGGAQPRVSTKDIQEWMKQIAVLRVGRSVIKWIPQVSAQLRASGFKDAAVANTEALMRVESRLATAGTGSNLYGGVGGLELYRADLREYNRLAGVAASQGVIGLESQRAIADLTGEQLVTWRQKTPEEIQANNRERVRKNGALIADANRLWNEIKALREYVDSKNGFVQTGLGDATVVVRLIGGISQRGRITGAGGALRDALNMPDVEYSKIDKVRAAFNTADSYVKQLRPRGANLVEHLRQKRENGYDLFGKMATVAGFIPVIGKPLALTLNTFEAGARYLSGDITAAEAVAKSVTGIVGGALGSKIAGAGSMVSQVMRSTVYSATSGLVVDLSRILSNPKLTGDQRSEAIRKAMAKMVIEAFQSGVSKAISGGIGMNDDASKAKLYEQFWSLGEKFGLEPYVMKPILEPLK